MNYGKRNQVCHDKRGDKLADKVNGLSHVLNIFRHTATEYNEDFPASPASTLSEMKRARNERLQLEILRIQTAENMRRRII